MSKAQLNVLKLANIVSVRDFGALGDDSNDDTSAIQAAIDSLDAVQGGTVFFPPGLYKITAGLTITKDFVHLLGDNVRGSAIRVQSDVGNVLTVEHETTPGTSYINGFSMSDLSIRARVEATSGAALYLNKVQNAYLSNVSVEDFFGGILIAGGNAIYSTNLHIKSTRTASPVSWSGVKSGSYFAKIVESADGQTPTELFFTNFNWRRQDAVNYVQNGLIVNAVDGVWLNNGHIMGVDQANLLVTPGAADAQITGIKCVGVWFDNNSAFGVKVTGDTSANFGDLELDACRFLTNTDSAVYVDATSTAFEGIRMTGGQIRKAGIYGAYLAGGLRHTFSGVDFGACNTTATANAGGIGVIGGTDKVTVTGCTFDETASGVTATSMIGVYVAAAASSQVMVTGNSFDLTAADVSDASTSDANMYPSNITTRAANATTVTSSTLDILQIGDVMRVSDGLNFNNVSSRWDGRQIVLDFAGASTVTHTGGLIELHGSTNFVAAAGDTLSLVYSAARAAWVETGRTVA